MNRRTFLTGLAASLAFAPVVTEQVVEAADDGYRTDLVEVRQIQDLLDEYKRRPEVLAALDRHIQAKLAADLRDVERLNGILTGKTRSRWLDG